MPSVAQLSKTILVVGEVQAIHDDLKRMSQRHTIKYIPNNSRQQIIKDIKRIAQETRVDILFFMDGSLKSKPIDEEVFAPLLPHLSLVSGIGCGFDHMAVEYLERNQVFYSNTPKAVSFPTATTATMLILQTLRAASHAEIGIRRGGWRDGLTPTPDTREVVVGILGMGTIGKLVCQQVQAFGMQVIYHNRRPLPREEEFGAQYVSFEQLLQYSDIITIHCPLTPQSRHTFNDATFSKMRKGMFIVNTSRGSVIDEEALVRAMEDGTVSRVGLDVFEKEPFVHPYLMKSERATLLPHWGTSTTRTVVDAEKEGLANITAFLATGTPNTPVNNPFNE
ncbi:palmitoyltransferase pfa5 [Tulasnella sp. UAMH 9824]|nr:palmitoyltransferase pfa5 [Tulasnella sp. UAMH 9824]